MRGDDKPWHEAKDEQHEHVGKADVARGVGATIVAFGLATGEDANFTIVHALIIAFSFILVGVYTARQRLDIRVRGSEES